MVLALTKTLGLPWNLCESQKPEFCYSTVTTIQNIKYISRMEERETRRREKTKTVYREGKGGEEEEGKKRGDLFPNGCRTQKTNFEGQFRLKASS